MYHLGFPIKSVIVSFMCLSEYCAYFSDSSITKRGLYLKCRCQSTNTEKPKSRNLLDNASNLLTNFLSGGNLGSMPTAEGAVSDLFGRPLFLSLYDWFLEVFLHYSYIMIILLFYVLKIALIVATRICKELDL